MGRFAGIVGILGGMVAIVAPGVGWLVTWLRAGGVAFTTGVAGDLSALLFLAGGVLGPAGLLVALVGGGVAFAAGARPLAAIAWIQAAVAVISWLLAWLVSGVWLLDGFAWA